MLILKDIEIWLVLALYELYELYYLSIFYIHVENIAKELIFYLMITELFESIFPECNNIISFCSA